MERAFLSASESWSASARNDRGWMESRTQQQVGPRVKRCQVVAREAEVADDSVHEAVVDGEASSVTTETSEATGMSIVDVRRFVLVIVGLFYASSNTFFQQFQTRPQHSSFAGT